MILTAKGVRKSFGSFLALSDINISVSKREISSIIGPNGAGKTTLFNILSGHLKADEGTISFLGSDVTNKKPHQLCKLGMAKSFQKTNIFAGLSAFENIQISIMSMYGKLTNSWTSADRLFEDEVNDILEKVGLFKKQNDVAGLLSHGDQRRLEIGLALGSKPSLLLLDEPTAGMGPEESLMVVELIVRLKETSELTVLFIEHDMNMVFRFSERIRVMHGGVIMAEGSPDDIRKNEEVQRIYLGENR